MCSRNVYLTIIGLVASILLAAPVLAAEEKPINATELAKAAQNPVADMISIPFQNDTNFNVGPSNQTQNILNIQPVIPINLTKEWNLITRTIAPITYTPYPEYQFGLGNIQFTGFLSPAQPGKFVWGFGPVFQFPTHTDTYLGSDKWSAGPSAVGLFMDKDSPWVIGLLVQNIWSFAGPPTTHDNPTVNQFLAQPFINYNLHDGWYLTFSPIRPFHSGNQDGNIPRPAYAITEECTST